MALNTNLLLLLNSQLMCFVTINCCIYLEKISFFMLVYFYCSICSLILFLSIFSLQKYIHIWIWLIDTCLSRYLRAFPDCLIYFVFLLLNRVIYLRVLLISSILFWFVYISIDLYCLRCLCCLFCKCFQLNLYWMI